MVERRARVRTNPHIDSSTKPDAHLRLRDFTIRRKHYEITIRRELRFLLLVSLLIILFFTLVYLDNEKIISYLTDVFQNNTNSSW